VHIISERRLKEAAEAHPDAASALSSWKQAARIAQWSRFAEVKQTYAAASLAGKLTIFNIRGNKYRLIVYIDYADKIVFVRRFLTHAEYDKEEWKSDPWY